MFAVLENHIPVVKQLLARSADCAQADAAGRSALHFAAHAGNTNMVKLLLEHKADANKRADNGATALVAAAQSGSTEVAATLLMARADVTLQDNLGLPALSYAESHGHAETAALLRAHIANARNSLGPLPAPAIAIRSVSGPVDSKFNNTVDKRGRRKPAGSDQLQAPVPSSAMPLQVAQNLQPLAHLNSSANGSYHRPDSHSLHSTPSPQQQLSSFSLAGASPRMNGIGHSVSPAQSPAPCADCSGKDKVIASLNHQLRELAAANTRNAETNALLQSLQVQQETRLSELEAAVRQSGQASFADQNSQRELEAERKAAAVAQRKIAELQQQLAAALTDARDKAKQLAAEQDAHAKLQTAYNHLRGLGLHGVHCLSTSSRVILCSCLQRSRKRASWTSCMRN